MGGWVDVGVSTRSLHHHTIELTTTDTNPSQKQADVVSIMEIGSGIKGIAIANLFIQLMALPGTHGFLLYCVCSG